MKEIKTKFGILYIEDAADRSEAERIKLFDSRKCYFDYLPVDGYEESEVERLVSKTIEDISKMQQIDELMDYLGIDSYTVGQVWIDLLEDIYGMDGYDYDSETEEWVTVPDGDEITEADVMRNEYVCSIGDMLILFCD